MGLWVFTAGRQKSCLIVFTLELLPTFFFLFLMKKLFNLQNWTLNSIICSVPDMFGCVNTPTDTQLSQWTKLYENTTMVSSERDRKEKHVLRHMLDYIPPHWCSADDLATVLARTSCLGNELQAQNVQQWVIALPTTAPCWRQSQQARWNTLHSSAAGKLQSRYEPP